MKLVNKAGGGYLSPSDAC